MLIECLVQRPNGSLVTMPDGAEYLFLPDDQGRHVAEVDDEKNAEILLGIPEGYRLVETTAEPAVKPPAKRAARTKKEA
jgi:hypothetical protein